MHSTQDAREQYWSQLTKRFRKVSDKLGKPIDGGVLETVVALNALGIPTLQSCEGHLEHGNAAPWVDITTEQTKQRKNLLHRIEKLDKEATAKYERGVPMKEIEPLWNTINDLEYKIRLPVVEKLGQLLNLLSEFYNNRNVSTDTRLIISCIFSSGGRLESQGSFLQEKRAVKEKRQKLFEYQEEMHKFTAFLKAKYFQQAHVGRLERQLST